MPLFSLIAVMVKIKRSSGAMTAVDADAATQQLPVPIAGSVNRHVSVADATVNYRYLCSNCGKRPIAAVTHCFNDWCEHCDLSLWITRDEESIIGSAAAVSGHCGNYVVSFQPMRVSCDLSSVGMLTARVHLTCQAVIFVVNQAAANPVRRHVLLIDATGCTGLTVWGAHVPLFTDATVGTVVNLANLRLDIFRGKMNLTLGKDSCAAFLPNSIISDELKWWQSLPDQGYPIIADILDCSVDSVVNVSGIVGSVADGSFTLVDRSGWVRVKSLEPADFEFSLFINQPLQLQRVRVTTDKGAIILMMLTGGGTIIQSHFTGDAELLEYWTSAV
jgi:hypothetical protein